MNYEKNQKKEIGKNVFFISLCSVIIGALTLLIAFSPEIKNEISSSTYNKLGLDKPELVLEEIRLNGSKIGQFDGCPAGYYLDQPDLADQTIIYLNPKHELTFSLRNKSKITDNGVKVKNISLKVLGYDRKKNSVSFPDHSRLWGW